MPPSSKSHHERRAAHLLLGMAGALWLVCLLGHVVPSATWSGVAVDTYYRIDVNTAAPAELDLLPNVGPRLAEKIIAERQAGPFTSVQDMRRVSGVGQLLPDRLRSYVKFQ